MTSVDHLWGGLLTEVKFDPVRHTCELHVTLVKRDTPEHYVITAHEVNDFRFHNEIPLPWNWADVTEAHLDVDALDNHILQILLWSESAEIVIHCSRVDVCTTPG